MDYSALTETYLESYAHIAGKPAADAVEKAAGGDGFELFITLSEKLSQANRERELAAERDRIEARILARDDQIRALCEIGGRPDLAAGFIRRRLTEARVIERLRALKKSAADRARRIAAAVADEGPTEREPELDTKRAMPCHASGAASLDALTRDFWRQRAATKREEP